MIYLVLKLFLVIFSGMLIQKAWEKKLKWDVALPLTFVNLILVIIVRMCE